MKHPPAWAMSRRALLAQTGLNLLAGRAMAAMADLGLPGGPGVRDITTAFPDKGYTQHSRCEAQSKLAAWVKPLRRR